MIIPMIKYLYNLMNIKEYINFIPRGDLIFHLISFIPLLGWIYITYRWIRVSSFKTMVSYQKRQLIRLKFITSKDKFSDKVKNIFILIIRLGYLLFWILFPLLLYLMNFLRAEDISLSFNKMDKNNDGKISIKEFIEWIISPLHIFNSKKKTIDNKELNLAFNTAALPPGMHACMNTGNISKEEEEEGVLATYDWKCKENQTAVIQHYISSIVNRFYYINYCLFLIVLLIFTNQITSSADDWRKNTTLMNWIFISLFFGFIGTTLTVLDTYAWFSIIFVDLSTTLLSMNVSSFAILILAIINSIYFSPKDYFY